MKDRWAEIEENGGHRSPQDLLVLEPFARAAASACIFELFARRYADGTPSLRRVAFKELSVVVEAIRDHVQDRTSDEERAWLNKCVTIRNKLLHLELSRATGQLRSLGIDLDDAHVDMFDLATGTPTDVSTTSTQTGSIYGWLFEATGSSAFERCVRLFVRGQRLIRFLQTQDSKGGS